MKIDSLPAPAIEKDGNGRGYRDGANTEKAGSAFGEAVKKAGEKRASKDASDAEAVADEAEGTDTSRGQPGEGGATDGASDIAFANGDGLQNLLFLFSAAPNAPATADEDAASDAGATDTVALIPAEPEEGDASSANRFPRVRVLRTETHFEPRVDGALDEAALSEAPVATGPSARATDDAAERLAQDLARTLASPAAGAAQETSVSRPAGLEASVAPRFETKPAGDLAAAPVRFDEVVARLGQPTAAGKSETGTHQGRREAAPRGGSDRLGLAAVGQVASPRTENRTDPLSAAAGDASGSDGSAPGTLGGLASQVAARIADALGPAPSAAADPGTASAPVGNEAHLRLRAGGAALRTLTIQLQPEHLGTLEVSMRLREGKLAIELAASKPEAAAALTQDRETLRKVLESAGFRLDDAAVTVTTRESATARVAEGSSSSPSGDGASGSGSSGDLSRQNGQGPNREREHAAAPARESDAARPTTVAPLSRSGGQTYL